jgi:5'-methylthioadenosine phosphorylase
MAQADVGIIGGTGLGEELLRRGGRAVELDTPFGSPSAAPVLAEWQGVRVAFLARHGNGHAHNPSSVPYRANIWALKTLGVKTILASGATGSLREAIEPTHLVLCDQVIDKTFRRAGTFFDEGIVAHVELADPFCPRLRHVLTHCGQSAATRVHPRGTYVCMEGPQFSTRAESLMHRQWGGDVIGMTCMPEARLAREAEICYALIAIATDYDCWRPHTGGDGDSVLASVLANLRRATDAALKLIEAALPHLNGGEPACTCREALKMAIWTNLQAVDPAIRSRFQPLIGRYLADGG